VNIIKQWPVFSLLLAFAIAPLFQGPQTGVLVAIHILVLAVFIKVFLASYQKLRIPYNSLALFICLFYLWMALSISWSPSPSISLFMFVWLSIFPLCFFIYSLKQPGDWAYLPIGILVVTLIFTFIGIGQNFVSGTDPISLFATRNTYAAMLNLIALPATAYFISHKQSSYRLLILWGMILFVLFFAVFQTGSKGATISLLLGLVFIFVPSWKYTDKSSFIKVGIIVITAFLFANIQTEGYTVSRLEELSAGSSTWSIYQRLLIWQSAWGIIKTAPVIGIGIGTYYIVEPAVRHIDNGVAGFFVHNDYLQLWLETGFIGLSLMLFIMVAISMLFMRLLRENNLMLQDRLEITGLMAGLFAVAIHTFVDFNFYIIAILMIMGLMCARIQEISRHYFLRLTRDFVPAHKLSKKIFILVALVVPFVILSYSMPVAIADFYMYKANKQLISGQIEKARLTLRTAALWNPASMRIRVQQYSVYRNILRKIKSDALRIERKSHLVSALLVLNEIEDINPLAGVVPEGRGHLLVENSDIAVDNWNEKAVHEFEKALQLQPRRYGARIALARLLAKEKYLNEAVALMNDGVNYYYQPGLRRLGEFYQYAIELNLMKGDTIKAEKIQIKLDEVKLYYKERAWD
jgi:O-antigen ligase